MNKQKITALACLFFLCLGTAFAQETAVEIKIKSEFGLGDTVSFDYNITSDTSQEMTFAAFINCPTAPLPPLWQQTATIGPSSPHSGHAEFLSVDESIEPQTCTAYVQIFSPITLKQEKEFKIEAKPGIEIEIKACKEEACRETSTVFNKGQIIVLTYASAIEGLAVNATLEFPDKTTKEITLPYSFTAEQTGTYNLAATASNEGYRSSEQTIQFGVIEKEPEITGPEWATPEPEAITPAAATPAAQEPKTAPSTGIIETIAGLPLMTQAAIVFVGIAAILSMIWLVQKLRK
ncbi:MAG: hypothetical protein NT067_05205 [Candidatus Diapherotrites archaeon]|nr:hypothetical protein [Candidatus Diapherotrites archaeon]